MRREEDGSEHDEYSIIPEHGEYSVVGRCSIVKEGYDHDWDVPLDKSHFLNGDNTSALLHMDMDTLTTLTLNSLDLKNVTSR